MRAEIGSDGDNIIGAERISIGVFLDK